MLRCNACDRGISYRGAGSSLNGSLPIQVPVYLALDTKEDGPSVWVIVTHVQNPQNPPWFLTSATSSFLYCLGLSSNTQLLFSNTLVYSLHLKLIPFP